MNLSDLGHAVALREIARDPDLRRLIRWFGLVLVGAALWVGYVAAVLYCVLSYLGLS